MPRIVLMTGDVVPEEIFPVTLAGIQNPVTRTVTDIVPAIEVAGPAELEIIAAKFGAYCQFAWGGVLRLSPEVIGADWLSARFATRSVLEASPGRTWCGQRAHSRECLARDGVIRGQAA